MLQQYTLPHCTAPPTTSPSCPSLALANRSACLQRLRQQGRSLEDIDAAVAAGYPADRLYKVVERRGQCLAEVGRCREAEAELKRAKQLVQVGVGQ